MRTRQAWASGADAHRVRVRVHGAGTDWLGAADVMERWDGSMDGEPRTGDVERQNHATADGPETLEQIGILDPSRGQSRSGSV